LEKMKKQLKQPENLFEPESARVLHKEIKGLQDDIRLANDLKASNTATLAITRSDLDKAYKELASHKKELEAAQTDAANFKRQLGAARSGVHELFTKDEINMELLESTFGKKGIEKLQQVLSVPVFDARGRISKLTGFVTVVSKGAHKVLSPLLEILEKAFKLIKEQGTSWVAILAPWVNIIVKDIVTLDVQEMKIYRFDLENRIKHAGLQPRSSSINEKIAPEVANGSKRTKRKSWKFILNSRLERAKLAFSSARGSMALFSASVANSFRSVVTPLLEVTDSAVRSVAPAIGALGTSTAKFVAGTYTNCKIFVFSVLVVFKLRKVASFKSGNKDNDTEPIILHEVEDEKGEDVD